MKKQLQLDEREGSDDDDSDGQGDIFGGGASEVAAADHSNEFHSLISTSAAHDDGPSPRDMALMCISSFKDVRRFYGQMSVLLTCMCLEACTQKCAVLFQRVLVQKEQRSLIDAQQWRHDVVKQPPGRLEQHVHVICESSVPACGVRISGGRNGEPTTHGEAPELFVSKFDPRGHHQNCTNTRL
ncbi:hypothetical protein K437DRAFT_89546 [Tilletiaria anomala UBC 951]|uniref:Uncharacterized protein n=1 Tax=Tilletiaria anomala (strain ATCC 24038 / CBS 436.72 / UBC 951) TaxID=1037660 RepID=A0A066W2N4_TILAU|nr:uncharacterized protein K437DRAFT_89546 [Tilletiaria anomala UBC 951]KDN48232.1 hypothetical protein K437DRAFT_89546 [Tilletiaria anomala UBC 951]